MRISFFKKFFLIILLSCSLTGCVYLVVGGIGALGGYIVSPDTVEAVSENNMDSLWDAAIDVISIMGVIDEQQKEGGVIIARVSGAKVTVKIDEVSKNTVRLTVKARKAFLPKMSVAQEVFVKIMTQLNG